MEIEINYEPLKWAEDFHTGDWKWACCVGGLGSGKSRASIEEIKALALENPGYTYLIGRKTFPSLRDTAMKSFFQCMEPGLVKDYNQVRGDVTLINGARVIFRGLDDVEKLKSLEIAGFFINEANEITKEMFDMLKSRTREKIGGREPTRYRGILDLNPVDEGHWIPQVFMFNPPSGHKLFQSTTYDNVKNLPQDYIQELQRTYSTAMQERMIWGLFTKIFNGRPVYDRFKGGGHIVSCEYDPLLPLVRVWDFGYNNPAVVWMQIKNMQVRILAEKMGKRIYLDDFIKDEVLPYELGLFGKDVYKHFDYCDPHGSDESDKGKTSVSIMNENGIYPVFRKTSIKEGIRAVKSCMDTKDRDTGAPNFLIHPRCTILIEGFEGGYRREDDEDDPFKDGWYDHLQDCCRYGIVHLLQRAKISIAQRKMNENQNVFINPHTGRRVER